MDSIVSLFLSLSLRVWEKFGFCWFKAWLVVKHATIIDWLIVCVRCVVYIAWKSQLDSCHAMPVLQIKYFSVRLKRVSVIIDKDKNIQKKKQ